jgi:O-methyltransferase
MSWLEQLITLHRDKDAAYGDAWCRRGEAAGIFPNIARKYDRWQRIHSQPTPDVAVVEPLDDTLADLCIYAIKYLLWLRARDVPASTDLPPGIGTVDGALTHISQLPLQDDPDRALVAAFMRLESSFLERHPEPSGTDPALSSGRARHTWELARSAWTLLQRLTVRPLSGGAPPSVSTTAILAAGAGGPHHRPDAESPFVADLLQQLVAALVHNPGPVLLLGQTPEALHLSARLRHLGLGHHLVGITDPALPTTEADGPAWASVPDLPIRYVVVCDDASKERLLREFVVVRNVRGELPAVVLSGTQHLGFTDPVYAASDAPALVPSYATGYPNTRIHMFQHLQAAARSGLHGAIVEFGAFKGGTTAWLARTAALLGLTVPILAFDSWDGFPPRRSLLDLYEHPRCIFRDLPAVQSYLEPLGVQLIVGDISDTAVQLQTTPVLLAFIDTDNYSPAHAALTAVADNVIPGGAIVFDHYTTSSDYLYTLGERMAAQDVLAERGFLNLHDSGVFLRMPDAIPPRMPDRPTPTTDGT